MKTIRRGRPKSDRPKFDVGTPEQIMKRATLSPTDPTMSSTPLDVLKVRHIISDEAHTAAGYFAALRKMVFGKAHPSAIDLTAVSGMPSEHDHADAERKYRDACFAMKAMSSNSLHAVENLVVHERWPGWLLGESMHGTDYMRFCVGISALLGWYKGNMRKAA